LVGIESFGNKSIESVLEVTPTFAEDDRVARVIGYLRKNKAHEVFVPGRRRMAGATVRELLPVNDPSNTRIGGLVYSLPEVTSTETFANAARLMFDYRLWALPSRERNGRLRTIKIQTLLQMMADAVEVKGRASEVMTPNPVTIEADDTALKARSLMTRRNFDHLVVMKDGKLQGVVSSSDILFSLLQEERAPGRSELQVRFDYPVAKITRAPILEVEPSSALSDVIEQMLRLESAYAVVRLWDEVQGIITLRDALKPLIPTKQKKSPVYIVGLPSDPFEEEAARMKLERLGNMLTTAIPSVKEIRAVVKSKDVGHGRHRYEVRFEVYGPKGVYAYSAEGYDLPSIFDKVGPRLKRILSSRQSKVTRSSGASLRKQSPSELM
jgi:CBS domain-containing protein